MKPPSIKRAERVLGSPAAQWQGRCFAIATQFVELGLVKGVPVYGHWLGPIAPGSFFDMKASVGFVQHGWVLLPDGRVCDPTRFVFEDVKPYIYVGPADHYDEGGNRTRMARIGPPPPYDDTEEQFALTTTIIKSEPFKIVEKVLRLAMHYDEVEPGIVTKSQLRWLANCDPAHLMPHTFEIYQALAKLGFAGHIPIDNRRSVERAAGRSIR